MPFIKRIIKPENLCRNNPLLATSTDILHDQNKFIYINFLQQIPSLSEHTNEILSEIYENLDSISERVETVNTRIKKIQNQMPKMPMKVSLMAINDNPTQIPFQTTVLTTNIVPITVDMPASLRASYDKCLKSPDLDILDALRTDGIKTMKLYSDPLFFFDHWKVVMGKELKERRKRKKNRTKLEEKKIAELPKTRKTELINKTADIYGKERTFVITSRDVVEPRIDVPISQSIAALPNEPPPSIHDSTSGSKESVLGVESNNKSSAPVIKPKHKAAKPKKSLAVYAEKPANEPEIPPSVPPRKSIDSNEVLQSPSIPPPPPPPPMDFAPVSSNSIDVPPPPMALLPPPVLEPSISQATTPQKDIPKNPPATPAVDPRDQLLGAIRGGSRLRKVEAQQVENTKAVVDPVAAALAERFQYMAMSDSDDDNSDKNNDDEW